MALIKRPDEQDLSQPLALSEDVQAMAPGGAGISDGGGGTNPATSSSRFVNMDRYMGRNDMPGIANAVNQKWSGYQDQADKYLTDQEKRGSFTDNELIDTVRKGNLSATGRAFDAPKPARYDELLETLGMKARAEPPVNAAQGRQLYDALNAPTQGSTPDRPYSMGSMLANSPANYTPGMESLDLSLFQTAPDFRSQTQSGAQAVKKQLDRFDALPKLQDQKKDAVRASLQRLWEAPGRGAGGKVPVSNSSDYALYSGLASLLGYDPNQIGWAQGTKASESTASSPIPPTRPMGNVKPVPGPEENYEAESKLPDWKKRNKNGLPY